MEKLDLSRFKAILENVVLTEDQVIDLYEPLTPRSKTNDGSLVLPEEHVMISEIACRYTHSTLLADKKKGIKITEDYAYNTYKKYEKVESAKCLADLKKHYHMVFNQNPVSISKYGK